MYKQQNTILQPQESSGRDVTCSSELALAQTGRGRWNKALVEGEGGGLVTVQGGTGWERVI